jgi:hypothetical protein
MAGIAKLVLTVFSWVSRADGFSSILAPQDLLKAECMSCNEDLKASCLGKLLFFSSEERISISAVQPKLVHALLLVCCQTCRVTSTPQSLLPTI